MHYEIVRAMSPEEYGQRLLAGWRRFGYAIFQPRCERCRACRSLRVVVDRFRPNRSQRRAWKMNTDLKLVVGPPSVSEEKVELYDRFHEFQRGKRGWEEQAPKEESSYVEMFVANPFPALEWCYYLGNRLVAVGYVDHVPQALSAIYFFYDPAMRRRSLGTFNILRIIECAKRLEIPHVYLGYFVEGCRSLEYKANFAANQIIDEGLGWRDFRVPATPLNANSAPGNSPG